MARKGDTALVAGVYGGCLGVAQGGAGRLDQWGEAVDVTELVDQTAAAALEHAAALQHRLRAVGGAEEPALRECNNDLHRLIGDIVSLRNAAELLKRMQPAS
jgi:hypothetical protein